VTSPGRPLTFVEGELEASAENLINVLLYALDMGPIERNIARQAYRSGQPMPDRIANAPTLATGLAVFFDAFFQLDTERSHGTALTPIPVTSILLYCGFNNFDRELTEDMLVLLRKMDNAHLARLAEKRSKD